MPTIKIEVSPIKNKEQEQEVRVLIERLRIDLNKKGVLILSYNSPKFMEEKNG